MVGDDVDLGGGWRGRRKGRRTRGGGCCGLVLSGWAGRQKHHGPSCTRPMWYERGGWTLERGMEGEGEEERIFIFLGVKLTYYKIVLNYSLSGNLSCNLNCK